MRQRPVLVTFGVLTASLAAGYGVLFTMLDDYRDEYGIGESSLGAIIGIGFFAGFVAQVLIAPVADRGHARRIVLGGMLLNVAGLVLLALATTFIPLMLGRMITGIGIGMAMPAVRRIVILSDPDRLGHNLGRLLSIDVAGFAVGPLVSAVLVGPFGIPAPFLAIAVATVVILPFVWRHRVPETSRADLPAQRFAFDLLRQRAFAGAVLLGCGVWVMIGAFDALWAVALTDVGASRWVVSVGITIFAIPLVLFGAVGGRLAQRVGPYRVGAVGLVIAGVAMFAYGFSPGLGLILAVVVLHSLSDGFTMSSAGVAVGMVVPPDRQAGAQGVLGGVQVLAAGSIAIVVGTLYEFAGRATAYGTAGAAVLVFTLAGLVVAGGARRVRESAPWLPSPAADGPAAAGGAPAAPVSPVAGE